MLNFQVQIPELDQISAEKREQVLKACLESPDFKRRVWRVRLVAFAIWLALVFSPPYLLEGQMAKHDTLGKIYVVLALLSIGVLLYVVPYYAFPRILRRLIRERLPDA